MTDFSEQVVKKTLIDDLYIIERPVFKDDRGLFKEVVRFGSLSKRNPCRKLEQNRLSGDR